MLPVNSRRQALSICLDSPVVVVEISINSDWNCFGFKLLQIETLAFAQNKEAFNYCIVRAVSFPAHALPDAFLLQRCPAVLLLILPLHPNRDLHSVVQLFVPLPTFI